MRDLPTPSTMTLSTPSLQMSGRPWKTVQGRRFEGSFTFADNFALFMSWIILVITMPFSLIFCIKIVTEYKRLVIYRLGRLVGTVGPGVVLILPLVDEGKSVDLRVQCYDFPFQEMLTRDSIVIAVNAAVYYRMSDPLASLKSMKDPHKITKNLTQTTLRTVVSSMMLSELISNRSEVSNQARELLDVATSSWGIRVERLDLRDLRMPRSLCRVMAQEAEAKRASHANLIRAEGETKASFPIASTLLVSAADELSRSKGAMQLRFLQTLSKFSRRNHTLIVPIPTDIAENCMKWAKDKINGSLGRCTDDFSKLVV